MNKNIIPEDAPATAQDAPDNLAMDQPAASNASLPSPVPSSVDNHKREEDDSTMNAAADREYVDAKLETIEARMDGRVASIEASISGFLGRQDERSGRLDDRLIRMEQSVAATQNDVKSLRSTIVITAISTVLAITLGVAAFNATVLSNMLASFESGKNTAAAQAEVRKQSEETAAIIKQMQEDLKTKKTPGKRDSM